MKPLERLTERVTFRSGLIVFGAMTCLALSSACEQRVGLAVSAANTDAVSSATSAAGETRGTAIRPFTEVKPGPPSAKEIRGASPYAEIKDEPPPKLFVDPPLPDLLDQGVVWIQWRVENVNVLPVFGKGALHVSPRVGHLHVHVDDVPWWWADASNINTIDLAGLPPGPHRIRVVLVDANHEPFPDQSKTVRFTIAKGASRSHSH